MVADLVNFGYKTAGKTVEGVQELFESITEGPDNIEKLSVAFNEEIEQKNSYLICSLL